MKRPLDCHIYGPIPGMPRERWRFLIRYPDGSERDVFGYNPRIELGDGQTLIERERTFPGPTGRAELDPVQVERKRQQLEKLRRLLSVALKQIEHDYRSCVEYAVAASVERWKCDPGRLQLRTYSNRPEVTDVYDLDAHTMRATVKRHTGEKPGQVWHTVELHDPDGAQLIRPQPRRQPSAAPHIRRGTTYEHEPTTDTTERSECGAAVHVPTRRPEPQQRGLGYTDRAREICSAIVRAFRG